MPVRPFTRRDWLMAAAGALISAVLIAAVFPRYEIRKGLGLTFLRIDRWTGDVAQCTRVCESVINAGKFDVSGARQAGYTDAEIASFLKNRKPGSDDWMAPPAKAQR